jgi:hypothetical protein
VASDYLVFSDRSVDLVRQPNRKWILKKNENRKEYKDDEVGDARHGPNQFPDEKYFANYSENRATVKHIGTPNQKFVPFSDRNWFSGVRSGGWKSWFPQRQAFQRAIGPPPPFKTPLRIGAKIQNGC